MATNNLVNMFAVTTVPARFYLHCWPSGIFERLQDGIDQRVLVARPSVILLDRSPDNAQLV
jgi:hypothetical protein